MTSEEFLLQLVRVGIDRTPLTHIPESVDWRRVFTLADSQGVSGVVMDAMDLIPLEQRPEKKTLLQLVGTVFHAEEVYAAQKKSACALARLFSNNAIRTYVLKGLVIAECYPNPVHRFSADFDCYLVPSQGDFAAWELGNQLIEHKGYEVDRSFYKNSTLYLPGLTVENHKFMLPIRGNKNLKALERVLERMIREDEGKNKIEGTELYRPPVLMSALFLIEHTYSHFLHEGLTWRAVLDWVLFCRKHGHEWDWDKLNFFIDTYSFRRFYDSFDGLGKYLFGELALDDLTALDRKMLADVWAPLKLTEESAGLKLRLTLAGHTVRSCWKYRDFAPISMPRALWNKVTGFLFERRPGVE